MRLSSSRMKTHCRCGPLAPPVVGHVCLLHCLCPSVRARFDETASLPACELQTFYKAVLNKLKAWVEFQHCSLSGCLIKIHEKSNSDSSWKVTTSSYPSWLCLVYRTKEAMNNGAEPGLALPHSFASCCRDCPPCFFLWGQKTAPYTSVAALSLCRAAWKVQRQQMPRTWSDSRHSLHIFHRNQNALPHRS